MSIKNRHPQISIRVVNKRLQEVQCYKDIFGGNIYLDNTKNGCYVWSIQSREDIYRVKDYFLTTCKSYKSNRIFLINDYFKLRDLNAYKVDNIHHKAWLYFLKKWN
jgi:ubiquinol-cytochrome c reductase cytochrome b subunit